MLILLAQSGGGPLHHVSRLRKDSRTTFKRLQSLGLDKSLNHSEDFIWHRLSIAVATQNLDRKSMRYTVEDLSLFIVDCGPSYFSPNHENPMLYFFILLMAQEFEQALDYLHFQHRTVEAVHFALVMYYYGMLQTSPRTVDPSSAASSGSSTIVRGVGMEHGWGLYSPISGFAFHRLLDGYCKNFSQVWPGMTADYYAMLHDEDLRPITANEIDGGSRRRGDVAEEAGGVERLMEVALPHRLVLFTRKPNHISNLIGDPGPRAATPCCTLYSGIGKQGTVLRWLHNMLRDLVRWMAIQLFRRTRTA